MGEILMVQNLNLTLYSSLFVLVSMSMFISYSCLRVLPSLCLVISVLSRLLIFSFHLRLHLRVRLHPAFVCFFFFSFFFFFSSFFFPSFFSPPLLFFFFFCSQEKGGFLFLHRVVAYILC